MEDSSVAEVSAGGTLTLDGVKEGQTGLALTRPAAMASEGVPEVATSIPVTVRNSLTSAVVKAGRYVALVLRGDHVCADEHKRTMKCADIIGHVSGAVVIDHFALQQAKWDKLHWNVNASSLSGLSRTITSGGDLEDIVEGPAPGIYAGRVSSPSLRPAAGSGGRYGVDDLRNRENLQPRRRSPKPVRSCASADLSPQ